MTHDQELLPCLFKAWDEEKERVVSLGRLDEAFEIGFRRAWNTRATPCPVTKEEAQAALDDIFGPTEKGDFCVQEKHAMLATKIARHYKTIRALLERAAKGE